MTKNILMTKKITYPTKWQYGNPKGSIQTIKHKAYKTVFTPPLGKTYTKYFYFHKYDSKEDAFIEAQDWLYDESKKHNVLTNEIRYLDKDTIEVKLTMDKTLKTDAKYLDTVQKYDLCMKRKKTKDGFIYYAHYRDGRTTYPFNKLISDI